VQGRLVYVTHLIQCLEQDDTMFQPRQGFRINLFLMHRFLFATSCTKRIFSMLNTNRYLILNNLLRLTASLALSSTQGRILCDLVLLMIRLNSCFLNLSFTNETILLLTKLLASLLFWEDWCFWMLRWLIGISNVWPVQLDKEPNSSSLITFGRFSWSGGFWMGKGVNLLFVSLCLHLSLIHQFMTNCTRTCTTSWCFLAAIIYWNDLHCLFPRTNLFLLTLPDGWVLFLGKCSRVTCKIWLILHHLFPTDRNNLPRVLSKLGRLWCLNSTMFVWRLLNLIWQCVLNSELRLVWLLIASLTLLLLSFHNYVRLLHSCLMLNSLNHSFLYLTKMFYLITYVSCLILLRLKFLFNNVLHFRLTYSVSTLIHAWLDWLLASTLRLEKRRKLHFFLNWFQLTKFLIRSALSSLTLTTLTIV
jgi:hypothetical protein